MKFDIIKKYAEELKGILAPVCIRIEIAGSIRRKRPESKDIELVCIPDKYRLEQLLNNMKAHSKIFFVKNGKLYKQFKWSGQIVDLFICQPENWGWIYFIRTGSSNWNKKALQHYRNIYGFPAERDEAGDYKVKASHEGYLLSVTGEKIFTLEEQDVFDLLKIPFVEPEHRERK
ncbi:MAG: hypothetical protein IT280_13250 [Ignavibacteria bacterium]|nr:hypothetical protein [Ignavibacteria bacterium]